MKCEAKGCQIFQNIVKDQTSSCHIKELPLNFYGQRINTIHTLFWILDFKLLKIMDSPDQLRVYLLPTLANIVHQSLAYVCL